MTGTQVTMMAIEDCEAEEPSNYTLSTIKTLADEVRSELFLRVAPDVSRLGPALHPSRFFRQKA